MTHTSKTWYIYILRCADDTLYCGITTHVARRLAQHNGHKLGGARYTKARRPVHLCAYAPCAGKSEAGKTEYRVRTLPRAQKIAAVLSMPESHIFLECPSW